MEKVRCYEASVEYIEKIRGDEVKRDYIILGIFKSIRDAKCAAQFYFFAFNNTIGRNSNKECTGPFKIQTVQYSKQHVQNAHIMTVQDFIEKDSVTKQYSDKIGPTVLEQMLKAVGFESQEEKQTRIIESLTNEYKKRQNLLERVPGISEEAIEDVAEKVEFLNTLSEKLR